MALEQEAHDVALKFAVVGFADKDRAFAGAGRIGFVEGGELVVEQGEEKRVLFLRFPKPVADAGDGLAADVFVRIFTKLE